jgi:hypothetical protein
MRQVPDYRDAYLSLCSIVSRLHQYSTGTLSTQSLAQATKGKVSDEEERLIVREGGRGQTSPLFSFSQIPVLLLVVNNSI